MTLGELRRRYPAPRHRPVLVSECTRMKRGYLCVAGWDIHRGRLVRPLRPTGENWPNSLLNKVFRVGAIIDCSPSSLSRSRFPHATEDMLLTRSPESLQTLREDQVYTLLLPTTVNSIRRVFGQPLVEDKYMEDGVHCPSLGGVRVERDRLRFEEDDYGRLRLNVLDSDGVEYRLPVTCEVLLRVFSPGESELEPRFGVAEADEWLSVNPPKTELILRIGLARGWAGPEGIWTPLRCYAQLNGIVCPKDNYAIFAGPPAGW